jgi:hypothetical protein
MDKLGVPVGWLVIFDMELEVPWITKLFWDTLDREGKAKHVVDC